MTAIGSFDRAVPILVGVVGHRFLAPEDLPALRARLAEIFAELEAALPATPLLLLSPLAEGADRLAAEVALERGIPLIAPLPMAVAEYEKDFASEDSLAEFRGLCARAVRSFPIPGVEALDPATHEGREACYERIGAYVAHHAQVLIALWDGEKGDIAGPGTAQAVRFMLEGMPPELPPRERNPLDEPETGPVIQIFAPRAGVSLPEGAPRPGAARVFRSRVERLHAGAVSEVGGGLDLTRAITEPLRLVERYNRDQRDGVKGAGEDVMCRALEQLLPGYPEPTKLSNDLRQLARAYALADALALRYQAPTHRSIGALFLLGALGYLAFAAYSGPWQSIVPLLGYNTALLLLVWLWLLVPRHGDKDRYQDYRALAEGLRVQFYWNLAGIDEFVADRYLTAHRSEIDWIRHALRGIRHAAGPPPAYGLEERREGVRRAVGAWVDSQLDYFRKGIEKRRRKTRWAQRIKTTLFGISALMSAIALPFVHYAWAGSELYVAAVFLAGAFPALGAAYAGYVEKMAFALEVRHFTEKERVFHRAREVIGEPVTANDLTHAQRILVTLGQEALVEHGEWLQMHRERYLEPPMGG